MNSHGTARAFQLWDDEWVKLVTSKSFPVHVINVPYRRIHINKISPAEVIKALRIGVTLISMMKVFLVWGEGRDPVGGPTRRVGVSDFVSLQTAQSPAVNSCSGFISIELGVNGAMPKMFFLYSRWFKPAS